MTCPHGMPSPASCVDCMDEGPVATPTRWQKVGGPFAARYPGECAACGRLFLYSEVMQNERIQRWDLGDERTVYTHADCGTPPRPSP